MKEPATGAGRVFMIGDCELNAEKLGSFGHFFRS